MLNEDASSPRMHHHRTGRRHGCSSMAPARETRKSAPPWAATWTSSSTRPARPLAAGAIAVDFWSGLGGPRPPYFHHLQTRLFDAREAVAAGLHGRARLRDLAGARTRCAWGHHPGRGKDLHLRPFTVRTCPVESSCFRPYDTPDDRSKTRAGDTLWSSDAVPVTPGKNASAARGELPTQGQDGSASSACWWTATRPIQATAVGDGGGSGSHLLHVSHAHGKAMAIARMDVDRAGQGSRACAELGQRSGIAHTLPFDDPRRRSATRWVRVLSGDKSRRSTPLALREGGRISSSRRGGALALLKIWPVPRPGARGLRASYAWRIRRAGARGANGRHDISARWSRRGSGRRWLKAARGR